MTAGNKRKICFVTGSRAEYGLLRPTLRLLNDKADVQLIVTGAHLSKAHGMTVTEIENDGFNIYSRADLQLTDTDCPAGLTMGFALSKIAHDLDKLRPDMVVVIGDRYEMCAAAMAAAMCRIPIAHIGGGELSAGAIDDSLRHAITKLSYWHLVSTGDYRKRVYKLGEPPERVFNVGAPGIDNLVNVLPKKQTLEMVDIKKCWQKYPQDGRIILFSWHPETLGDSHLALVLNALDKYRNVTVVMTGSNADDGGQLINQQLIAYATSREGVLFNKNFPTPLWNSLMACADVVVGNSSCGVIEAPAMGRPSVDIGIRQQGRIKPPSVSSVPADPIIIDAALRSQFHAFYQPSGVFGIPGHVAPAIVDTLLTVTIPKLPIKHFYDGT